MHLDSNTPIGALTVGQLMGLIGLIGNNDKIEIAQVEPTSTKRYVYGLMGIRTLFNVSHATAQRYKDTFLQPAIMQNGRKIIVDVEKAMSLFNDRNDK